MGTGPSGQRARMSRAARGAIVLAAVVGVTVLGWTGAMRLAHGDTLAPNQWSCSVSDSGSGCSVSSLATMPEAEGSVVSATAPCPVTRDTCIYDVSDGRTAQAFDVSTGTWTWSDAGGTCATGDEPTCAPESLTGASATEAACPRSDDACVYVIGGTGTGGTVQRTVEAYDTATNQWTSSDQGGGTCLGPVACMPTARTMAASVTAECPHSDDRCVYMVGGITSGDTVSGAVEAYDPGTNEWVSSETGGTCANASELACLPTPREGLAGAASARCPESEDWCVYAVGGSTTVGGPAAQTVEAYDPVTNEWVSSDAGGTCANGAMISCLPTGVEGAEAVSAPCPASGGSEVIFRRTVGVNRRAAKSADGRSGGDQGTEFSAQGEAESARDAVSADNSSSGTEGNCVYVIGGSNGGGAADTSQAYDPAVNAWVSSDTGGSCANSSELACMPTARTGAGATTATCTSANATCIYVTGGTGDQPAALSTVEAYDAQAVTGTTIYVSPTGSDSNSGSYFFPLGDLQAAQKAVRAINGDMHADITVSLENGTYRLTQPLAMDPEDSGTGRWMVQWSAAPGETPIISGGERITGWKLSDAGKNIWWAPVRAGLQTRQLYVNGTRAVMAYGAIPVTLRQTATGYRASAKTLAHWRNPGEIEFAYSGTHECFGSGCPDDGLGRWTFSECPVASMEGRAITMAQPCWNNSTRRTYNFAGHQDVALPDYIQNAYELLNQPGEFYLDQSSHRLYYIPRPDENMTTADVEAPVLQMLAEGAGTASDPIRNIAFSGVQFTYATWLQPSTPQGFSEVQAGYTITDRTGYKHEGLCKFAPGGTCPYGAWTKEPGNVQFSYDQNLQFVDDQFLHLGAAGLNLDDGTQDATVQGSVFTDISGNGVELGNVDLTEATGGDETADNRILDNHIYSLPVEFQGGVAILVGYASDNTIAHNQIDHTPYTGISLGWAGWPERRKLPPTRNNSHGNVIADNLIFDVLQRESDGGGIYNQGTAGQTFATGEQITGNVVHSVMLWGRGIQSDEGAQYITYSGNVLYDDNYDMGPNHVDWSPHTGAWDPLRLIGNYWQQGTPDSDTRHVLVSGNHIIDGPEQAPASITEAAGVIAPYASVLSWEPAESVAPSPPGMVTALYAFGGSAYVTWEPSLGGGSSPITSYTVTCGQRSVAPVVISASEFDQQGYVIVPGLTVGKAYLFTVTAQSASGISAPSPMSRPAVVREGAPAPPGTPHDIYLASNSGDVTVMWYAALGGATPEPALGYVVTASNGEQKTVTGPGKLAESNRGGRVLVVFSDLVAGHSYRFSIAQMNPEGVGRAAVTALVKVVG